uniref:Uncharacterized protein LOC111102989 n=1 Tax=Crassostrea virginica TaxID=6565 RepID=A0A8B8ANH5_CRAVI|nr:uncharacterized protein LOC111102989 [Crassostrea virginica]XP_022291664.1 uncharacterized protein LOC111102989 [Crassostrea virginica]
MSDAVFGCFACIACVVIVLFNVGCFTPNWITLEETKMSNSTTVKNFTNATSTTTITRTCHHGLFYSIDCPESAKVFDETLIGLNIAISACLSVIPIFWSCIACILCCCGDSDESCADGCCSFYTFFYAFGGLLGLVSSSMVIAKYDTSLLGWSFFLTVAAVAIVLLQVVLMLTYSIHSRGSKEKCSVFLVYRRRHYKRHYKR